MRKVKKLNESCSDERDWDKIEKRNLKLLSSLAIKKKKSSFEWTSDSIKRRKKTVLVISNLPPPKKTSNLKERVIQLKKEKKLYSS